MVVVAIIGLMASLAVYSFIDMTRKARRGAVVRELHTLLLEARAEARARNQPVRIDVRPVLVNNFPGFSIQWGRLPCDDAQGRNCPGAACGPATQCGAGCVGPAQGQALFSPTLVDGPTTFTNLAGLCFVGSLGVARGPACDPAGAPVANVRIAHPNDPVPLFIVFEPVTGMSRIFACGRDPLEPEC